MRLAVRAFAPELDCLEIFRTSVINFKEPLVQLNKVSFEMLTLSHSSHTYPNVQAFSYVRLASLLLLEVVLAGLLPIQISTLLFSILGPISLE